MSAARSTWELDRFRTAIADRFGLTFDDARASELDGILERRARANAAGRGAYVELLAGAPSAELRALARELTVGETYFFRNRAQLDAFTEVVLRERSIARAATKRLRFLSAGCSSGEEPYTLAILAKERLDPSWEVSVLAIDVNPAAIERATRAVYSPWSLRETPEDTKRRWFRPMGRDVVLDPTIRAMVRFEEKNLRLPEPSIWLTEAYDAIFCRNVIMYFTQEVASAVVERARRSLAPGGYLFLGHAETLRGITDELELCHTHETFYYRRGGGGDGGGDAIRTRELVDVLAEVARSAERIEALDDAADEAPISAPPVRSPPARIDLAEVTALFVRERYAEALERLDALSIDAMSDPDALLLRAILLMQTGRLVEAEAMCSAVIRERGLDAGARYVLAVCRESGGDLDGAADQDRLAIYLDPTFAMPRFHLGVLLRRRGDRSGAVASLEEALALLPHEDTARLELFGGGFNRATLERACRAELRAAGAHP